MYTCLYVLPLGLKYLVSIHSQFFQWTDEAWSSLLYILKRDLFQRRDLNYQNVIVSKASAASTDLPVKGLSYRKERRFHIRKIGSNDLEGKTIISFFQQAYISVSKYLSYFSPVQLQGPLRLETLKVETKNLEEVISATSLWADFG